MEIWTLRQRMKRCKQSAEHRDDRRGAAGRALDIMMMNEVLSHGVLDIAMMDEALQAEQDKALPRGALNIVMTDEALHADIMMMDEATSGALEIVMTDEVRQAERWTSR